MITSEAMTEAILEPTDEILVRETLAGNRGAFERIIARYQTLICSLAYSATGSVPQSEDLAQETFITAWKQLPKIREQGKLRAWLCGIARFTISNALRKQGREPSHAAEPFDTLAKASATEAQPAEHAISKEEQGILWRAIEHIPAIYREPLVLFYREHHSIQAVAATLDLTENTVKQRLSRGRKLLHQDIVAIVETGIARTNPGRSFTIGVLAALPAFLLPAQAVAAVATVATQGTGKTALGAGLGAALLAPVTALFGTWIGYRMDLDSAGSPEELQLTRAFYRRLTWGFVILFATVAGLIFAGEPLRNANAELFVAALVAVSLGYALFIGGLMLWWTRAQRTYLAARPDEGTIVKPAWEYRSEWTFCRLPLVHIRIGGDLHANRMPVCAWIAIGNAAIGGLFAFGGIAVAPLSIGGCALGLLPFGGVSLGLLAVGGFSVGVWSFGGLALGWQAFGGCAIGWSAAAGGAAVANDFALGGTAHAAEANTRAAAVFVQSQPFFKHANHVFQHHLAWLNLIWVTPILVWWRLVRKAKDAALE